MDAKEILRHQAIARALGEIEAAQHTFTTDDADRGYPSLYKALAEAKKLIRDNW